MNKTLLAALILGISIVGLSIGSTVPVIALRLYQAGASNTQIGIMSALPAAGMMLSAFLVNGLCQRLSRRQIYLLCFSLCALSIGALEIPGISLTGLGLARIVMGFGAGLIIILGETWVNEMAADTVRGRVIAVYTTCFTVFQMIGPGLVALLGTEGPAVIASVSAGYLLAIAVIWLTLPHQRPVAGHAENQSFSVLGFIRVAPALCVGILFFAFFDTVILSLFPVYAATHGYAIKLAALMVSIILLGDAAFQFPLGWLSDKAGRAAIYLGCGVVSLVIGLGLPLLMNYPTLLWPSLVILGAAAGGVYTLAIILIGQAFSGPDLVTANASAGLLWGIGSLLGPLLSGAAMNGGAHGLPLTLSAAAAVVVLFALSLVRQGLPDRVTE
ncbi:MFS transporter [Pseudomonas chlororaphis]|uniref:MFS transporter n=1 Tax=Pseudomonas chlororaphis TaxID=587753 RepID=UPI0007B3483E|nr:MFS transporter [Pseudomonas chlororaphis]AZC49722.1 putative MFS-type transporter [Pseudomonas chlororaphis subsp. piscium]AZC56303.1 putative MFS-type transporter [Pseudomonas chlororaphis subsp. piscium]AZC62514.1 putative MFS-type transporter [Pseudomonas chlororaphis subsp. piscium]AZC68751.1 putative MFS-type transporter [Pseudomonas chlororaphis subsp. piscium]AZC74939.1 putative MFS-type transporter [Pseudomonas chlororaphis subsp. piscium]